MFLNCHRGLRTRSQTLKDVLRSLCISSVPQLVGLEVGKWRNSCDEFLGLRVCAVTHSAPGSDWESQGSCGQRGIPSSSFGKTPQLCHFSSGSRVQGPVSHPPRGVTGTEGIEPEAAKSKPCTRGAFGCHSSSTNQVAWLSLFPV